MHTAATRRRVHNSTIEPLPSSAYSDQDNQTLSSASNSASRSNPKPQSSATQETPTNLSPAQRRLLERIIRVDQAGELGANWIYQGQLAVLGRGDPALARLIQVRNPTTLTRLHVSEAFTIMTAYVGSGKKAFGHI